LCKPADASISAAEDAIMVDAAVKALAQTLSPPFRTVLLKSVALALALLVLLGIGLHRLLVLLASWGEAWTQSLLGQVAHTLLVVLSWMLTIAAGLGVVAGAIFLMPAVTSLVASFFSDEIALEVERTHYPDEPAGRPLPVARAVFEGSKTAAAAIGIYLLAVPFLLVAGLGVIIFFLASAFLLGREYFELAAMRHVSPVEARQLRIQNQRTVLMAGGLIAAFVAIPIVNLATPLFGTALMVHVYKRLTGGTARIPGYGTRGQKAG
jgi:CysZ protein